MTSVEMKPVNVPRRTKLHPIKVLMVVATVLWPLGIIGLGVLNYMLDVSRMNEYGDDYMDLATGVVWSNSELIALNIWAAACFSTSVYAMAMVILFVLYFALKPTH